VDHWISEEGNRHMPFIHQAVKLGFIPMSALFGDPLEGKK